MLTEANIAHVLYKSDKDGKKSDRVIVPVSVPKDTVRAIDVSELTSAQQDEMSRLVAEYKQYMDTIFKSAFTFENWVEHTYQETVIPKWRSFKTANLTISD